MMELLTKARGKIEISEDRLITIPEGLFGFEDYTKFALVDSDYEPFIWLQSCEDPNLAFLIVDPFLICPQYESDIDDEALGNHLAIEKTAYYMGKDIEQVILCDAILMCPGWENSKGCKVEKFTAETYGKEVLYMK